MAYPENVEVNDESIAKLTTMFKNSYKEVVGEIEGATSFGVANRKQILAQIDRILVNLGVDVKEFIATELPDYYTQGAADAVQQLQEIGADIPVSTGFSVVHRQAIAALVSDTATSFGDSIQGVKRSAMMLLGKQLKAEIQQAIASGIIKGSAVREATQSIKGILADQGLAALVDKGGKKWQLDTYAEMLYRTKVVEARNMGLGNRMLENGYDLVQVSNHATIDPICAVWEDQILSLTGATEGYPTVDDAQSAGLFHPNCRHAINAIVPDLAKELDAYNPETGNYESGGGLDRSAPRGELVF